MTDTTPAPELWQCPFCGGKASHAVGQTAEGKPWHYVECDDCGAAGPSVQYAPHNIAVLDANTKAWNNRITPLSAALAVPEVRALVEAAKSGLRFVENTESELGVVLGCGDALRAALAALRGDAEHVNETAETEHDAGNVLTDAALRGEGRG